MTTTEESQALPKDYHPMSEAPPCDGVYRVYLASDNTPYSLFRKGQWHLTSGNPISAESSQIRSTQCYDGTVLGWQDITPKPVEHTAHVVTLMLVTDDHAAGMRKYSTVQVFVPDAVDTEQALGTAVRDAMPLHPGSMLANAGAIAMKSRAPIQDTDSWGLLNHTNHSISNDED